MPRSSRGLGEAGRWRAATALAERHGLPLLDAATGRGRPPAVARPRPAPAPIAHVRCTLRAAGHEEAPGWVRAARPGRRPTAGMAFFVPHFERIITCLGPPVVPRTNNHAERGNRRYRATARGRYARGADGGLRAVRTARQGFGPGCVYPLGDRLERR